MHPPPKAMRSVKKRCTERLRANKYSANGMGFRATVANASSGSFHGITGNTGPKISSCITVLSNETPVRTVGAM